MAADKIKILIADDHAIVREGLKQIVAEEKDILVSGEAENANKLMELLQKEKWSLVILDINMPGKSGLEALKDIKQLYPNLPVLILTMFSEDQYGIRAIKAGASGYLKKVSAPAELVIAIRNDCNGGFWRAVNPICFRYGRQVVYGGVNFRDERLNRAGRGRTAGECHGWKGSGLNGWGWHCGHGSHRCKGKSFRGDYWYTNLRLYCTAWRAGGEQE